MMLSSRRSERRESHTPSTEVGAVGFSSHHLKDTSFRSKAARARSHIQEAGPS